jgi:hypothetical protein
LELPRATFDPKIDYRRHQGLRSLESLERGEQRYLQIQVR